MPVARNYFTPGILLLITYLSYFTSSALSESLILSTRIAAKPLQWSNFTLHLFIIPASELLEHSVVVELINDLPDKLLVYPETIEMYSRNFSNYWTHTFYIQALAPGKFQLRFRSSSGSIGGYVVGADEASASAVENMEINLDVIRSDFLQDLSGWCGIISFAALFLSVYPQLIANHLRRSAFGLNLDYVEINLLSSVAFFSYTIDSSTFLAKDCMSYLIRQGVLAVNAILASIFLYAQTFKYGPSTLEEISKVTKQVFYVVTAVIVATLLLTCMHIIDSSVGSFIYFVLSFGTTSLKYLPQIVQNYKRQSSDGWCIGTSTFELLGMLIGIMKLIIEEYNYGDVAPIMTYYMQFWLALWISANHVVLIIQKCCDLETHEREEDNSEYEAVYLEFTPII